MFRSVMESSLKIFYFSIVLITLSAAHEVKKNLTGIVGGNLSLPEPVLEYGFLLKSMKNIALVKDRKLRFVEEIYMNKLHWNRNSGLFTITDLQRNDSGIYTIDSKRGRVFTTSHNLIVYDPPPTPAVETLTVSSESCWLICSVDNLTSLLWYKDEEILNQSSSAVYLPITVYRQDRDSSYRCVAANLAGNKTLHVNVTTFCWFNKKESSDHQRYYWAPIVFSSFILIFTLVVWMMIRKENTTRQTHGCIVQNGWDSSSLCLTTVRYNCLTHAEHAERPKARNRI
ncbi:PREDICTED: uncharacterized protein LOC107101249 [Cyprinodon variegatus]|uniref:uncharacterized protein LOC107101249 n=1 Tax=Cyprinodon variegatus TaxID=28743 RepID=UPI000742A3D3|nr:PREDICTED: uncharacterized protein LOC107101249 [Cyprinodon variegatus]